MKRIVLLTSIVLLSCIAAMAQSKFNLKGTIIDKENSEAVTGATVQLLSVPDSAFVTGAAANELGAFLFKDVAKNKYIIKVSFIGYTTHYMNVDLAEKKSRNVDLGYITLADDAQMLKEAQVTANAAKVQVSGDSLVYNASAYRVPEGSTLEALVKLLPGAKVDEDGNITINGKTVNKILVDGKEFFLNDKNVAMKNIPTDIIDKIKSYERKSDLARVTGIDDGEEETVIDLTVKKGMKNGWFGNATLGAGTEHLYNSRGMVNRFNDNANVSLIGNARNTPNRWGWNNSGLRNNKELGGNFATTSQKLETGGSVRYRYDGSDVLSMSSSENFAAQKGAFGESRNQSYSGNSNVYTNMRLEWKPDTMTNIIFRPNFTYSRNRGSSNNRSGSYDKDPNNFTNNALFYNEQIAIMSNDPSQTTTDEVLEQLMDIVVNTNTSRSQSYSTNVNGNGELQVNRKFNSKGRNLTLRITGGYSEGRNKQLSAANITYNSLGTAQQNNRYYNTPSKNYNIAGQITYNEPIADRTYLQFSYRYQYSYNKNDRRAYVYDSQAYQDLSQSLANYRYDIDGILRFMEEAHYMMRDTVALSQFSEYRNYNQNISVQYRKVRDGYNFSIGIDALPQRTTLNYKYMGKEYPEITRNVFNFAPRVNLRVIFDKHTNLQFRYNGRTSQPSMTNLLDIKDDSNPLYISKGNPGLKPSFSNNINANFNTYNVDAQRGIWAWGNFSTTSNSISNKTTYDKTTGVRTTMPMNINGNWNTGGGVGINSGLGEKKLFTIGGNFGGRYANNVGFYNNASSDADDDQTIKSITKNSSLFGGVNSSFRNDWINIEINGNLNWQHIKNNVNMNGNQDTYNFSYGAEFQYTMPWKTEIATDISMNSRRGYSQKEMNTNELLWNASISHSFMKGKALTAKFEVFDILGQQTNISRTVNAFQRSDSLSNTIYQYGMFCLIYRFSVFAGKNTMGTDQEKREWR
ncbi:MAG: outer membrane beta-barrel protein [Prevotellaceae bacterium]|nr:outer membrane beta-barrel protein [Candidatus Minthosoma caballi]